MSEHVGHTCSKCGSMFHHENQHERIVEPSTPYVLPDREEMVAEAAAQITDADVGTCARCGYHGPGPKHDCRPLFDAPQPTPKRASWDQYFMRIAREVAARSTCDRKHVGAVLVRDRSILSTGYNGSVRGLEHCDDAGHLMQDGHCVRTVHAEVNAVAQAARHGHALDGAAAYVTSYPCLGCFKMLVNAGLVLVAYDEAYNPDPLVEAFARNLVLHDFTIFQVSP